MKIQIKIPLLSVYILPLHAFVARESKNTKRFVHSVFVRKSVKCARKLPQSRLFPVSIIILTMETECVPNRMLNLRALKSGN